MHLGLWYTWLLSDYVVSPLTSTNGVGGGDRPASSVASLGSRMTSASVTEDSRAMKT